MLKSLLVLSSIGAASAGLGGGSAGGADWRYFAAGGISAATSHGITTPLDVVKTKMQMNPKKYGRNPLAAAQMLVDEEGAGFLLQGLGPTVVGYGIEGALKFGLYELFKPVFGQLTPNAFVNFILASVVAGAVASVVLCPCEDARIRMVSQPAFATGLVDALVKLVQEDGFLATFKGLGAMLAKQVPYTMTKQVSFDFVASALYTFAAQRRQTDDCDARTAAAITFAAAAVTSGLACVASQPGDVILTQVYGHAGSSAGVHAAIGSTHVPQADVSDASLASVSRQIWAAQGAGGFFVGLQARLCHVGGIITSQLAIYDYVKQGLGLAASGSR